MKSSHYVNAVRQVRAAGYVDEDVAVVLDSIAVLMGAGMPEPYGAQLVGRVRAVLRGETPATAPKAKKSPAARAKGAGKVALNDATITAEHVPAVKKGAGKKKAAARKRCPQCGRGAGFGSAYCQYDGAELS